MAPDEPDPHPEGAGRFLGRQCSFDHSGGGAPTKRLCGMVESAHYAGRTLRGNVPDYSLVIRGSSGRIVTVSLVEARVTFPE